MGYGEDTSRLSQVCPQTVFCFLACLQLFVAVFVLWPTGFWRPFSIVSVGACCVHLSLTSCMFAAGAFAIHLADYRNWPNSQNPSDTDQDVCNAKIDTRDISLACLIHGVLFSLCAVPLTIWAISSAFAWTQEDAANHERQQFVFALRCACMMLLVHLILPLFFCFPLWKRIKALGSQRSGTSQRRSGRVLKGVPEGRNVVDLGIAALPEESIRAGLLRGQRDKSV
eukprot:TRINITY_DN76738_c0_g1_i1.p1 TRINITY_DN76738_c0_g1~~TRINITY_DN76738_c0_g1_i1.p1  ORF type:complete len:226 (+),score=3.15 TRINITY_DN76738_c0_g1_i1:129-806(+)